MGKLINKVFFRPAKNPLPESRQTPSCWRYKLADNEHWFYSEEDPLTFDDLEDLNVVEVAALYEHPIK